MRWAGCAGGVVNASPRAAAYGGRRMGAIIGPEPAGRHANSLGSIYIGSVSYTLRLHKIILGHSELERDSGNGVIGGAFRPGVGYELVQPVFRLYSEAVPRGRGAPADQDKLARYYAARDKLPLELTDAAGRRVPASTIDIVDYTAEKGPDSIEIEVTLSV